jgi:hypothetical protein
VSLLRHLRTLAFLLAGAAIAGGAWLSWRGAPRLTLTNTGLQFANPAALPLYALVAVAGALVLLAALRRPRFRALAALGAALLLAYAAQLWRFEVVVGPDALSIRGLLTRESVAWAAVRRVDAEGGFLTLEGSGGERVSVATGRLPPEQRASLERAVARQIASAQMPRPAAPAVGEAPPAPR